MKKLNLDKEQLYNLYIVQNKSVKETAEALKVSKHSVERYLVKHKISKAKLNYIHDTESFIKKAQKIHGLEHYNYSEVKYINCQTPVKVWCNIHKEFFFIKPICHLDKAGCKKCAKEKIKNSLSKTSSDFIKDAQIIHKDKYDYSEVKYMGNKVKVKIYCKKCNTYFYQTPNSHLNGAGCPTCFNKKRGDEKRKTTENFIKQAKSIHGDDYDYGRVKYINCNHKVEIFCKRCNTIFLQDPKSHLEGIGCPICKSSKGEKKIREWLSIKNVMYVRQKRFKGCKNKQQLPFDFYLPDYNSCIEYQGVQHYKPIKIWGGEKALKENQLRDQIKRDYCKEYNIKLIEIKYNENIEKRLESELFGKISQ